MSHTTVSIEDNAPDAACGRETRFAGVECCCSKSVDRERSAGQAPEFIPRDQQGAAYTHTWEHCEGAD